MNIEHLSYSSISKFQSCPASWKFRYIDEVPTRTSVNLIFGSAWHNTIEWALLHPGMDPLTFWFEAWDAQVQKNPDVDWGTGTPETYYNDGIRMLQAGDTQELLKTLKVKEVEKFVQLWVPGVEIPVIGYIDVIGEDGTPGDFKTSSKAWSTDRAINEMQPLFYLAALNQAHIPTPGWFFIHYVFVKTRNPRVQTIIHTHKASEFIFLFGMIKNVWRAIQAGVYPENPGSWLCDPRFCEFWKICRGRFE